MSGPVHYSAKGPVAVIRMDDGKVNALGPTMQQALGEAIDRAEADNAGALVITGNERVFSGGFDLKILTSGEVQPAVDMLRGGFELAYRLLSYPKPVGDGLHRARHRDGRVPVVVGRSPGGRARLQHPGQRGRDRHGHPVCRDGDHEAAAHAVGLPAGQRAGQNVLRRNRFGRRLCRRDRAARGGGRPRRGGRRRIRRAEPARPRRHQVAGPRRRAGGHPRRDRRHRSRIRSIGPQRISAFRPPRPGKSPVWQQIASRTRGGRAHPMRPAPDGRNASTPIWPTGSPPSRWTAGCNRRRYCIPTATVWTSPSRTDGSWGCAGAPSTGSTTAGSIPRICSAGRPTPPPTGSPRRCSGCAARCGRATGTPRWSGSSRAAANCWSATAPARSASTPPGSCSPRSTTPRRPSRTGRSAPTTSTATPGCAPRRPPRR
ncbi:EchA3 [Mycobacterium avium subsp. paratuberculosis K-10]|uniref:EchA3 n=1 Tax=Mycolicibacterium paratuberculosis (strain ATCC BAA-968 / K-10) TaxID=262316 RepID=Q73SH2_MYCPA|nr:EchA3 [Mycobacterium avium subsp. paratuberculosis K-10]